MKKQSCLKDNINQLRSELHKLLESESFASELVQKKSQELDEIILLYYKPQNESEEFNEI